MLLKPFIKHIKSFFFSSLDFLIKCQMDVDEDNEIVAFDVTSFCASFSTLYREDLHQRFKKNLF